MRYGNIIIIMLQSHVQHGADLYYCISKIHNSYYGDVAMQMGNITIQEHKFSHTFMALKVI